MWKTLWQILTNTDVLSIHNKCMWLDISIVHSNCLLLFLETGLCSLCFGSGCCLQPSSDAIQIGIGDLCLKLTSLLVSTGEGEGTFSPCQFPSNSVASKKGRRGECPE